MRIKLYTSVIALALISFAQSGFAQGGDAPCSATVLTVTAGGACSYVAGTNIGATPSGPAYSTFPCSGVDNNDVWFTFTVPAGVTTLLGQVQGGGAGAMNYPIIYFYRPTTSPGCSNLPVTALGCNTGTPPASTASLMYSSFVPGEQIWVRVKPLGGTLDGTFQICIYNPCPSGAPANDNPCTPTVIPMTASCASYTSVTNFCATPTGGYNSAAGATSAGTTVTVTSTTGIYVGMPVTVSSGTGTFAAGTTVASIINATSFTVSAAPTVALSGGLSIVSAIAPPAPGCANYQGGDIWVQTTVGANGHLEVNFQQQTLNDPGCAVYTGTNCSNLTLVACDDDAGPASCRTSS